MRVAAAIPARTASSRGPGNPLVDTDGMSMIEHVARRVVTSESVDETSLAMSEEGMRERTGSFGGRAIVTGPYSRKDFCHAVGGLVDDTSGLYPPAEHDSFVRGVVELFGRDALDWHIESLSTVESRGGGS